MVKSDRAMNGGQESEDAGEAPDVEGRGGRIERGMGSKGEKQRGFRPGTGERRQAGRGREERPRDEAPGEILPGQGEAGDSAGGSAGKLSREAQPGREGAGLAA
ncbi:hypothetical protein B2K_29105 [Paenibacillus mucilaginosus K02]|uniref:Uncharacterized protein n=1 Tax=Paenibacillus mucilaginosus K02 TaxID=997761 RepID=I0BQR2_9BACL|nr:hypothetical protein B2K_29105 [Paenibacillus mucilaginosus K02]